MSLYDQWTRLTTAEQLFLVTHPHHAMTIRASKDIAFNETTHRFGANGHNDASDAFRHCFWSATLARDIGMMDAWHFTTAHESGANNHPTETPMDLHNNRVGLQIGGGSIRNLLPSWTGMPHTNSELSDACMTALNEGKLITTPGGSPANPGSGY